MRLRRIVGCSLLPIVVLSSVVLFACAQEAPDQDESAETTKSTAAALTDPDGSSDAADAGSSPTSCALSLSSAQSTFWGTATLAAGGQYEPIDFATSDAGPTSGSIWLNGTELPITNGFDLQFNFQEKNHAALTAEGFAVVFQSESGSSRGGDDGNLGYGGISDSLALEADSHQDVALFDPSYQHLSLHTLYASPNSANEHDSVGVSTYDPSLVINFDNSSVQELRVQYRPADPSSVPDGGTPLGWFKVWMNQNIAPTLQAQVNDESLDSMFTSGAYVGFTASRTTGLDEQVLISNVSLSVQCPAVDQCHVGSCDSTTGACASAPVANGTACDDGSKCTQGDTCQSGTCTGSPVVCTPSDSCHVAGTCDPSSGTCSNPQASDGTGCNDSNACTQTDTCLAGVCMGANPVSCTASDSCHVAGTCDPSSGTCSNPQASDGTGCDDSNACTQMDTCLSGVCTGANPVSCTASDQCHVAGTCDPANGTCSNPAASDGTPCDDSNPCTQTDTCQAGACVGSNPVGCNDGGSSDAGTMDAGNDAGHDLDAGHDVDAGRDDDAGIPPVVDAGSDSGTTTTGDSGVAIRDSGVTNGDSGTSSPDASSDDDSSGTDSGCNCRMTSTRGDGSSMNAVAFLALAIGAGIRRRRRQSPQTDLAPKREG